MPVFISWSGDRSWHLASALASFVETAIPRVGAWMSQRSVDPGRAWLDTLRRVLNSSHYGILCLTSDNLDAPWLLFEAGAISKEFERARVVPYLLDVSAADLAAPLKPFQALSANEEGTWQLLRDVASTVSDPPEEPALRKAFDDGWPTLHERIAPVGDAASSATAHELTRARERMSTFGARVQGAWCERIDGDGIGLFTIRLDSTHNSVPVDDGYFYDEDGRFVAHYRSAVARLNEQNGREGIVYLRECHRHDRDQETWFHGYGDMWFGGPNIGPFNRGRGMFFDGDVQDRRKLVPKSVTLHRLTDPGELRIMEQGTDTERRALANTALKREV